MAFSSIAKNMNEQIVLEAIRDNAIYSKQDLARKSGLSFPTVSKTIDEFVEKQMVLHLGIAEENTGGRKAAKFKLNEKYMYGLSIFFHNQVLVYVIYDWIGQHVDEGEVVVTGDITIDVLDDLIREKSNQYTNINAITVGVPGSVHNGKICLIDGYPKMLEVELEKHIQETFHKSVKIYNNMNAIALGIARKHNSEDTICIHLGQTGPGCGGVVNGKALSGFYGFNGEVGCIPFYGDKTLQEIALVGFQDINLGEYLGKIALSMVTIINPSKMILYIDNIFTNWRDDFEKYCKNYVPEAVLPEFIYAQTYEEDYISGLKTLGIELLFQQIQ